MSLDHAHLVREQRERERKTADRRLREVESRMGLMLESIKDYAMLVLDHRGRDRHLAARRRARLRRQRRGDAGRTGGAAVRPHRARTGEALSRRPGERGRAEREGPCRRRTARRSSARSSSVRCRATWIGSTGFVAVVRDVTERRASGGPVAANAEDGGHRPVGRRHRARLQQPADRDSRLLRLARAGLSAPTIRGGCRSPRSREPASARPA